MPKLAEFNLLRGLPKTQRNIRARAHENLEHHVEVSRQYGEKYLDGPHEYGYDGYQFDGRCLPIARYNVAYYELKRGDCLDYEGISVQTGPTLVSCLQLPARGLRATSDDRRLTGVRRQTRSLHRG